MFLSLLVVSVLVLLDVTDTDKPGIYSAMVFFSLLLPPKVNQGSRQPLRSDIPKAFSEMLVNAV